MTWFESWRGIEGIVWIFLGLYVLSALMTFTLTISPEARRHLEKVTKREQAAARGDIAGELGLAERA